MNDQSEFDFLDPPAGPEKRQRVLRHFCFPISRERARATAHKKGGQWVTTYSVSG